MISSKSEDEAMNKQAEIDALKSRGYFTLKLQKKDLINMVKGTMPNYSVMQNPIIAANGSYTGGHSEKWSWNYGAFENNSEDEILAAYSLCR